MQEATDLEGHRVEDCKENTQWHSGTVSTVRPQSMSSGRYAKTTHHVRSKHYSTQHASTVILIINVKKEVYRTVIGDVVAHLKLQKFTVSSDL